MIPGTSLGPPVLSVRNVYVAKEGTPILEGVTFDVFDRVREGCVTGQVVALLGPSGVGKTTLLRVIAALDRPDRGEVRGPSGARLVRGDVGVVFQDYPLLRHRTVEDNLLLAGRIGGLDRERTRRRARELLERVGLEQLGGRFPSQLSGGQRQRAAIAQQLVLPRRVLLLDEPFSGLDPAAVADIERLIVDVANEHELNTVVLVTHDIRASLAVSDTIVILRERATGKGARVHATLDLVELGVAWEYGRTDASAMYALERDVVRHFRDRGAA